MIEIFKTINDKLENLKKIEDGAWINMVNPSSLEVDEIAQIFEIDSNHIKAALDEEERARIENDDRSSLIIVDVPIASKDGDSYNYTTIPLAIILVNENIITVCTRKVPILNDFIVGQVKSFYTFKKTRFILQILYKNASYYLQYLRQIDRTSDKIERELHKSMKNKELIQLLELEKSLVYFTTSLRGNEIVMEKMLRMDSIKKYPEDTELLEDVIVENKQAIEMANIYTNILSGMMDAFASVISNNLNIVMKFLTSVTIVMAIPTMVASFFGMNVPIPIAHVPHAFTVILVISVILSFGLAFVMAKKRMF